MAQAIPGVSEEKKQPERREQPVQDRPAQERHGVRPAQRDDNMVYIGKKPTMSYVLAVMTQVQKGRNEIHIRARGRSISRAVDVAEVVRSRFLQDAKRDIDIGTEVIEDKERNSLNVSTINIRISRT